MTRSKKLLAVAGACAALPLIGITLAIPATAAPADVMEQVGVPSTGLCTDVVAPTLNWAGVTSGGWSKSWAAWISAPLGNVVCTRTLYYDNSAQIWARR
jgi:hypothetical protein